MKAPQLVVLCCAGALGLAVPSGRLQAYCRTMTCTDTCPMLADGCPGGGAPLSWQGRCVSYSVALGSKAVTYEALSYATDEAFARWRETVCTRGARPSIVPLNAFGPTRCGHHEYNATQPNSNTIIYLEGPWPHDDSTSALALTSVTFDTRTGVIFDADIEVNGSGMFPISSSAGVVPANSYDLQAILTHEVGHFLGLAHSNVTTATMWTQTETGSDAFRRLTQDDVDGICEIYPPSRDAECDYTPRQGFSPECRMDATRAGACSTAPPQAGARDREAWVSALAGSVAVFVQRRRGSSRRRQHLRSGSADPSHSGRGRGGRRLLAVPSARGDRVLDPREMPLLVGKIPFE